MNKNKKKLVPELRFPEFEKEGEWNIGPMSNLSEEITQKAGKVKYKLMSITSGVGLVSQLEKFGREIAGKSYKNYLVIEKGDFAYNKSATKLYPEGEIALLESEAQGAVPNSIFTCFRFKEEKVLSGFAKYLFQDNLHGKWLRKYITVGARANGALQVNKTDLFALPFPYASLPEQQKIASCLSSLDETITAQAQRLEALQQHKKGLMQQLFPQQGQKVPKLRFPKFEKEGEWEEKPLGDIAKNLDSRRIPITAKDREKGDIPYYGASGIIDYVKEFIFNESLLCISEDGANLLARTYPIAFSISGKTWVNNHAHVLKFPNKETQILVENYLNYTDISNFLTGMAQPKLNRKKLDSIPIQLPGSKEQQKIAAFLSSLDELIKAQTEKIAQLKLHKKGLIQQLFPSPK